MHKEGDVPQDFRRPSISMSAAASPSRRFFLLISPGVMVECPPL